MIMKSKNLPAVGGQKSEMASDHPFYSLQREMNNLFGVFFRGFDITPQRFYSADVVGFMPYVDVKENDEEFVIKAEIPGVDEKDINVILTNDTIVIKGEKKEEKEDKGKTYYYMERSYGLFNRVIPLAVHVEAENAAASFHNGVLKIRIAKKRSDQSKRTKVPIKSA
jgi:HSP20 family protein